LGFRVVPGVRATIGKFRVWGLGFGVILGVRATIGRFRV
jgi:hypothetical protein